MAKSSIRVKAKMKGDLVILKALIKHPMETGMRKDKESGKVVPAHFIQTITCEVGGIIVLDAEWGGSVSKNPYIQAKFKGANKGDKLKLSWVDNQGKSDSVEAKIK
jgi:sulfur-oxidizing protein SoxZ